MININSLKAFSNFYKDTYLSFYNELTSSFQYNELCNILGLIVDFSYEKFGISIENAKANVDYSIALEKSGKYREALSICEAAFDCYKKILGEEHEDIVHVLNTLSKIKALTGNYEEALSISEKALIVGEKILGQEHPETVIAMNSISAIYAMLGKHEEASDLLKGSDFKKSNNEN